MHLPVHPTLYAQPEMQLPLPIPLVLIPLTMFDETVQHLMLQITIFLIAHHRYACMPRPGLEMFQFIHFLFLMLLSRMKITVFNIYFVATHFLTHHPLSSPMTRQSGMHVACCQYC